MKKRMKNGFMKMAIGAVMGIIFTLIALNMGGCNMVKGLGQDIGDAAGYMIDRTNNGWEWPKEE